MNATDNDRRLRMERTVNKFVWLTYAITLMTNHFHLYLRTLPSRLPLSAIIDAVCIEFKLSPFQLRQTGRRHPARAIVA